MEFLAQYALFTLKTFTFVLAFIILAASLMSIGKKSRPKLDIEFLNEDYEETRHRMLKEVKGRKSQKIKLNKKDKPSVFVLDFQGDIRASQVSQLREEITAVLAAAEPSDEIVVRLDSPGGVVNGYGLAASQLQRIRDKHILLTVCIDKVAASGGYLMSCVADKIIAAPFALIGSIGVVAQIPNIHRLLKKNDIDVELITAGEYKRTLTLLGENTEKGRQKFQEDLEQIHKTFREYVSQHREQLDIEKVSTGEHWLARDAFDLKLVDELKTSDDYLTEKMQQCNVFKITRHCKQSFAGKLLKPAMKAWQILPQKFFS